NDTPQHARQTGEHSVQAQSSSIDHFAVSPKCFRVQNLLAFGCRFEGDQLGLEIINLSYATTRDLPVSLLRPSLVDHVIHIFAQEMLELRTHRFGITAHLP